MSEEVGPKLSAPALNEPTRLAYERTYLAHERTLMAWLRTALSLISFGFTISKFFEYLQQKQAESAPLIGAKAVGILMIAVGLVSLALASLQHFRAIRLIRERCPGLPRSLAQVTAGLLAVLGLLALVGAAIRL